MLSTAPPAASPPLPRLSRRGPSRSLAFACFRGQRRNGNLPPGPRALRRVACVRVCRINGSTSAPARAGRLIFLFVAHGKRNPPSPSPSSRSIPLRRLATAGSPSVSIREPCTFRPRFAAQMLDLIIIAWPLLLVPV
ncbi:hypothetical protein GUJ93_ZPchr0010g7406 [Zizania palustris]|uniref:Uncharacterized protein n=1 Tax=Zizania palustris TaxID=103762 RepID=A0A8J5WCC6_ZIZPA|nr:hypothetical protein GUJ93_ZPchr0010g7406 [Zizania palustris]